MATETAPAQTQTQPPAPAATDQTAAPSEGATTETAPVKLTAAERFEKFLAEKAAKKDEGTDKKPDKADDSAPDSAVAEKVDKVEDKKPDTDPPKDERISRGWAKLAQRDQQVARREREHAAAVEKWKSENAQAVADVAFVKQVRETLAKEGPAAAARLLGIDLQEAMSAMADDVEPSPEVLAKRAARAELERLQAAEKARLEDEGKQRAEREAAQKQVADQEWLSGFSQLQEKDYPFTVAHQVNAQNMLAMREQMTVKLGRAPSQKEVADAVEGLLKERAQKASALLAPPPPPAAPAKPAKEKTQPAPQSTQRRPQRGGTAFDRLNEYLAQKH